MQKFEEDQRLIQFLMGLNSDYNTVRGNLLMMRPLPRINQAYAILIQEEKQREVHASSQFLSESAALNIHNQNTLSTSSQFSSQPDFKVQHEVKRKSKFKKSIIRNYCKKPGHIASKCFRLIGFPKDFKFKGKRLAAGIFSSQEGDEQRVILDESNDQNISRNAGLTSAEYKQIMMLLSKAQLHGKKTTTTSSQPSLSLVNSAGPFNEEANGLGDLHGGLYLLRAETVAQS